MRLESIRYVLNFFDYTGKTKDRLRLHPDGPRLVGPAGDPEPGGTAARLAGHDGI